MIDMHQDAALLSQIQEILSSARGRRCAVTLDDLSSICGATRRQVEQLIEHNLAHFIFPLVAGSRGYFIPETAADINIYLDSLDGRQIAVHRRKKTLVRKALAAGFRRTGKRFENPPFTQPELSLRLP